jgi:hypothetical protein
VWYQGLTSTPRKWPVCYKQTNRVHAAVDDAAVRYLQAQAVQRDLPGPEVVAPAPTAASPATLQTRATCSSVTR